MRTFDGFKRGIDLGGWLSQCGKNYNEEHYRNFIKEEDFAKIADWGLDHVRLPIDYNVIQNEDGSFREEGFAHIDRAIAWCRKYGLHIILDIHKAKGFVFDDANYCSFFKDAAAQEIFIRLWQEMAIRYGGQDIVVFELLNEVTSAEFAQPWNDIIARTVPAIRKYAPVTRIIVGGIFNNSIYGLSLMEKPCDSNMVFTFHCYNPLVFTHQKAYWVKGMTPASDCAFPLPADEMCARSRRLFGADFDSEFEGLGSRLLDVDYFKKMFSQAIAAAEKYDLPLYCGEYGVIDEADPEGTIAWYETIHRAFEECGIARAAWSYRGMNFGISDSYNAEVRAAIVRNL